MTRLAALIGDPVRGAMLLALLGTPALTAGELAEEGGITAGTASSHLRQLEQGGLLRVRNQGRHRYYQLADDEVAHGLEQMLGLAQHLRFGRTRPGPKDPAMRRARVCYDHLAGEIAVVLFARLRHGGALSYDENGLLLTDIGHQTFAKLGITRPTLHGKRRLCRECLDWSERRPHLAGVAGAALLSRMLELGWLSRADRTRTVIVSARGEATLSKLFMD